MKNCCLSTCFKFPKTFSAARYLVSVEEIKVKMYRLSEDYGNINNKFAQWRSILIRFFKKHKPKFLHLPFSHHPILFRFVRMLNGIFKICHIENIKKYVQFITNQGGGGQGDSDKEKDVPVRPLEIFRFLNRIDVVWRDYEFFFSYPKLLTSLTEFVSHYINVDVFVILMELTSFTVLDIRGYRNFKAQQAYSNIGNMTNLKVLYLGEIDLKYNASLPMKFKNQHHLKDLKFRFFPSTPPSNSESYEQAFCDNLAENLPSTLKALELSGPAKCIDSTKLFSHLADLPYLENFRFRVEGERIIRACLHESCSYYCKSLQSLDLEVYASREGDLNYSSCYSLLTYLNCGIVEEIHFGTVKLNQVLEFQTLFDIMLNFIRLKSVRMYFIVQEKLS